MLATNSSSDNKDKNGKGTGSMQHKALHTADAFTLQRRMMGTRKLELNLQTSDCMTTSLPLSHRHPVLKQNPNPVLVSWGFLFLHLSTLFLCLCSAFIFPHIVYVCTYRWALCSEAQVQSHQWGAGPRPQWHDLHVSADDVRLSGPASLCYCNFWFK